jgi:thymidylate synthase (FAD)
MINIKHVGEGQVYLIAGGGKTYCDVAARFCRTEKEVDTIIASPQSKELIKALISSGHKAALEFDDFIFGISGYARVTEAQLIRKRHASYMIKSGRVDEEGKRTFDMVIPKEIEKVHCQTYLDPDKIQLKFIDKDMTTYVPLTRHLAALAKICDKNDEPHILYSYDYMDILELIENWYTMGVRMEIPEESLRYMKPQATEFKAAIKMNATALRDWALIRMCHRAQKEIRDLCCKMVGLAIQAAPELMSGVGPSCRVYGYCPESEQCKELTGIIPTKAQALGYLDLHRQDVLKQ